MTQKDNTLIQIRESIPAWLKERIERDATANGRSFAEQMALILERHYTETQGQKGPQ